MYKNHQMQGIITSLKRELADHQDVEEELAKRSHFCQKVIKKYKAQIESLANELESAKSEKQEDATKLAIARGLRSQAAAPVLAEHRCDEPIPMEHRAPPPPTRQPATEQEF